MKVSRELSRPENPKRNDDKKRKRTLSKILSAFGRGRKTASSSSSNLDVVDVPKMAPSPRVNISSVSSTSSCGERPSQTNGRVTMAGTSPEVTPDKHYVSTELSEKATQTVAPSSVPNANHYRRHQLPPDTSYSSYPKYNRGYPTSRLSKCEVNRRHPAEMTAATAVAAPSWRRTASRVPTLSSNRHHKHSSTNEMDILSFFDTGSVDHGYSYKCSKDNEAMSSKAIYSAREACEGTLQRLPSSESQSKQPQLMLEDRNARSIDHHLPSRRHNRTGCQSVDELVEDPSCVSDEPMQPASAPFHLQTVKNSHQCEEGGGPKSFWYCEKMEKSKGKRIPDPNECEAASCCERFLDPTKVSQQQAGRLQQTGVGAIINRHLNTEEKRRMAKIGAIILATAGVAALIMLMMKYKRQAQLCKSMLGGDVCCDSRSNDTCDDDDDGMCIFEKFDKVKCQNSNFKAMMSNCEKLIEHDDRVCASQDFKKVTKRLKEQCETKPRDIFCPCTDNRECSDINKKKCFDNF